ncbi:MAG: putative ABC transport system permease protein, partial [Planctomycetota bacterium]
MRPWTLVLRGLKHYWRTNVGVLIGSAIATATLVGALLVGDSVRHSLRERALARIGRVDASLFAADRSFRDDLTERIQIKGDLAPALLLRGVLSADGGAKRSNDVRVYGVDERFFALGSAEQILPSPSAGSAYVGDVLAQRLDLKAGDSLILRLDKPSALPRDMALSTDDVSIALTLDTERVIGIEQMGRFTLDTRASEVNNLFVPLEWLR